MRHRLATAALALAALTLSACQPQVTPAPNDAPITFADAALNGKSMEVLQGQTLRIRLESIPTAGYTWIVQDAPANFDLVREATEPTDPENQNKPGFTGGSHWMVFDFTAAEPGEGTFRLVEAREWELEAGDPPIDTWTLDVRVVPKP